LGGLEPLAWWAYKAAYNRADLVLATSHPVRALLEQRGLRRVELWQRGVDTELFAPCRGTREMRARLTGGHPEDKLLLYVGRLSPEKDIEMCRAVLEALPGVRLALVGDGPHRRKLEQHFAGTATFFAGYLRGQEVAAAFASADVFFLPSRTETLGLVLLEAMASGCPVVAAAEGGVVDVVQDGTTGRLFRGADTGGAIAAIRELVDDSDYRARIGAQGRTDTEQWSWAAATHQLEGFYRDLMRREQELPKQIGARRAHGASTNDICEALEISRATFRRHSPQLAPGEA
jgi:glycosyltransferase involved in cell wall biosynthesis